MDAIDNNLGDFGAILMSNALKTNSTLTTLDLSSKGYLIFMTISFNFKTLSCYENRKWNRGEWCFISS